MKFARRHSLALVLLALVCLGALWPLSDLVDAVTGSPAGDAELVRPLPYLFLAPLSTTLDALTFTSLPRAQWLLGVWAVALLLVGARRPGRWWRRAGRALLGPALLGALAAATVLLPRPVPRLVATRSAVTVIDYHAHTQESHDGRAGWTAAHAARWHARQGFEATYITDHNLVFDGEPIAAIPLLPGAEWSAHRQHVLALGAPVRLVRDSFTQSTARMLRIFAALDREGAIGVAALPEYWRYHWDDLPALVAAGAHGLEIVDCAPKGLAFPPAARARVARLAARHDRVVVGGSDNHGWGAVTCVWNLALPGVEGYGANRVLARPVALAQGEGPAWAAPVTQPWLMFRALTGAERIAWATWIVVILVYRAVPRRAGDPAGIGILARSLKLRALFRRTPRPPDT